MSQVYRQAAGASEPSGPCCMASKFMGPLSDDVIAVDIEKFSGICFVGFQIFQCKFLDISV